jgi:hypothetical protein
MTTFNTLLFDRAFIIDIGGVRVDSRDATNGRTMSAAFEIERDKTPIPNTAEIQIYNLNEQHRNALDSTEGEVCSVAAGYGSDPQLIFLGTIRQVESWREGSTWITQASAGDGEKELLEATIRRTFSKGTSLTTVLKALVEAAGIGQGNLNQIINLEFAGGGSTLASATTIAGAVSAELRAFTASVGLEWSIQNGAFQAHRIGEPARLGGPSISPTSGLVNHPRLYKKGKKKGHISLTCLLQPALVPGVAFRVESTRYAGDFVAIRTKHRGKTFDNDWYVEVDGEPL